MNLPTKTGLPQQEPCPTPTGYKASDAPGANDGLRDATSSGERPADIELLELISRHVRCVAFQLRMHADGNASFPYVSDNVGQFLDLSAAEIRADPARLFKQFHPADLAGIQASIVQSTRDLSRWKHQFQTVRCQRQGRWLQGYALPKHEADGAILWHGVITDVTERKMRDEQVLKMAYYDALTSLPNRRLLSERLHQAIVESRRQASYSALLFLDLDNFKRLNDTQGHAVGDLLLVEAAARLKKVVREMDTVARLGGDEFVVILRVLHGDKGKAAELAGLIAEKIRSALATRCRLAVPQDDGSEIMIEHGGTASIGITLFRNDDSSQADILRRADRAMYQAKEAGRDTIRYCEQSA